jgi:eukaryotic-like serine/threonine-protein kinase
MLSPETTLQGRYRIVRQLGQGGMGAVYEALDLRLDTVVALKETLFTEERLRKQFEREARLLARLHHQALPRVSDHFTEGDGQFLVMQYVPGEDLFEMQTRQQGPFSQEDVLRWADQLCDVLDYLHTQDPQIIHRDIKPQNLKITARGQIVLLDFGLAKGSGGQMSVVTTSASIFGFTPNYAPLEQVQGLGTDPRSDIYSLGATLYHLLTNVKPPDALSRAGAIVNGQADPLVPAHLVCSQVNPAISAVLQKAMSQKRDERYSSAMVLRAAMNSAVTQPAGQAATVITPAGVATGANTVSPVVGTHVGAVQTQGIGNEAQTLLADDSTKVQGATSQADVSTLVRRRQTTGRTRTWLAAAIVLIVIAGVAGGFYIYRARQSAAATESPATQNPPVPVQPTPNATPESSVETVTTQQPTATPKTEAPPQRARQSVVVPQNRPTPNVSRDAASPDPNRIPPRPSPQAAPTINPIDRRPPPPTPGTVDRGGVRIETRPDGTRVVTFPDGRTRVFPPGTGPAPNRRRRPN